MNTDLDKILTLAQDVVDSCFPVVPSRPLIELDNAAGTFTEESHDDDDLAALADAISDITSEWQFWPEEEFGSRMAIGVSADSVIALEDAIKAIRDKEDKEDEDE